MSALPSPQQVATFRELVADRMGLHFDESRTGNLVDVLRNHMALYGPDCSSYLDRFAHGGFTAASIQALARDLTISETFFFRGKDQIDAFLQVALPGRLAALAGTRNVRVLCAGCASGEEPYSLAIAIREQLPESAESVSITGFDLNSAMIEKATHARYSNWSLRDASELQKTRWFARHGNIFSLDATIRSAVELHARNLASEDVQFWQPGHFDIVFCRNTLMYFTPAQARAAVQRITHALVPDGYLFLGHAETLRGLSNDFHLCHTNETFYYRRKSDLPTADETSQQAPWIGRSPLVGAADSSWVDIIGHSTRRISELMPDSQSAAQTSQPGTEPLARDLSGVLEHLHNDRFDRALEELGALPPQQAVDPDVLLLKAVSLCHSAELDAAQAACRQVLEREALNSGAHYVLALCREGVGDAQGAINHDQEAAYLDGTFAMPRLHLGLLAKRRGDFATAQRELQRAMSLLQNEDPARLLLFGGGFRREALIALCRAESAACAIHTE